MPVKNISSLLGTLICTYGVLTLYNYIRTKKRMKTRLEHINQYENQGYVIANSSQISNRYNSIPLNQPVDYRGKELVRPYMEQLERKLGNDIRLARKNCSILQVQHSPEILKTGASGLYIGGENTSIIKYVNTNSSIIGHEVLHMASYMYDPTTKTNMHGFMQQKDKAIIATGLNEGYTELLNARLFNNGKVRSYKRLVRIVRLLEEFFPTPQTLSHYYFTCDLPACLQTLRQYCTNEELKEILYGLDKLYEYSYVPKSPAAISLEAKLAAKLYNIYARNFASQPAKVEAFKQKVCENRLAASAIENKKHAVQRTNPFKRIKTFFQNGFRKVKNFFVGNSQPTPQHAYTR